MDSVGFHLITMSSFRGALYFWDMAIKCLYYLVPETGIKPVWSCGRGILSPKWSQESEGGIS
jgi:hypothetical protein